MSERTRECTANTHTRHFFKTVVHRLFFQRHVAARQGNRNKDKLAKSSGGLCKRDCYDANFRLQPLTELESERNESRDSTRDSKRRELEREYSLYFFMREDWEPARSRETMTTRQPTLATNPVFSQSEPDRQLSKG